MFPVLYQGADQLHSSTQAQIAAVKAEIIAVHRSPSLRGIVFVIRSAALVGFIDKRFGLVRSQVLPLGHPADSVLHGSVDKNAQVIGIIRKSIVRTAANNDAGALSCKVANGIEGG